MSTQRAALECSERMLEAARAGRWDELLALHRDREILLRTGDTGAGQGDDGRSGATRIERMLAINEEILALGAAHRDELMRAFGDSRHARRAVGAYAAGASIT